MPPLLGMLPRKLLRGGPPAPTLPLLGISPPRVLLGGPPSIPRLRGGLPPVYSEFQLSSNSDQTSDLKPTRNLPSGQRTKGRLISFPSKDSA